MSSRDFSILRLKLSLVVAPAFEDVLHSRFRPWLGRIGNQIIHGIGKLPGRRTLGTHSIHHAIQRQKAGSGRRRGLFTCVVFDRLENIGQYLKRGYVISSRRSGEAWDRNWNCESSPSPSIQVLTTARRWYIEFTSRTSCGDHNLSAMAAVRGQMRESIFSGETYSAHMQASPPRIRFCSSGVRLAAAPLSGSVV